MDRRTDYQPHASSVKSILVCCIQQCIVLLSPKSKLYCSTSYINFCIYTINYFICVDYILFSFSNFLLLFFVCVFVPFSLLWRMFVLFRYRSLTPPLDTVIYIYIYIYGMKCSEFRLIYFFVHSWRCQFTHKLLILSRHRVSSSARYTFCDWWVVQVDWLLSTNAIFF